MNENDLRPITDEDRRLAESKKLTLNPIHNRITSDDVPDEQIATNHLVNPPIANAPNDTEQDSQPIKPVSGTQQPTPTHNASWWQKGAASLIILVIFILGGIVTGAVFFLTQ